MRPSRLGLAFAFGALLFATPAAAEILVGVAAPLSGRFAEQGLAIQMGVEDAVTAVNAMGGLLGQHLRIIAVDDGCEAKAGAEVARQLVARDVAVVIGHTCPSAAIAAAPIYAEAKIVLLALTRHPDLTEKRAGPTIFRVAGRDDRQGETIAAHILKTFQGQRIALIHDRTQYGRGLAGVIERVLAAGGTKPLFVEGIVAGNKDYSGVVQLARQAAADVIFFGGFPAEAAILFRQLRAAGLDAPFLGADALAGAEAGQLAPSAAGQVLVAYPYMFSDDPRHALERARADDLKERSMMAMALWRNAADAIAQLDGLAVAGRLAVRRPAHFSFDAKGDPLDSDLPSYIMLDAGAPQEPSRTQAR